MGNLHEGYKSNLITSGMSQIWQMRHSGIVNFEDTQENHRAFNRIKHQLSRCSQGHCAFNTILFLFTLSNLNLKFASQNVVIGYKQLNLLFSICKHKSTCLVWNRQTNTSKRSSTRKKKMLLKEALDRRIFFWEGA